jgi:hypothetical protein
MVAKPGSLSRSTVTGESREEAGFSFSVPVLTGDRLDEAAFSPSFPVPSSSTDCRLDDFGTLMPESCTRTNCEFGASMEDEGCNGRSNTTLGIKFLKKRQHEDDNERRAVFTRSPEAADGDVRHRIPADANENESKTTLARVTHTERLSKVTRRASTGTHLSQATASRTALLHSYQG